ncbi:MAG TPA: phospholipase D family protein [Gaiellaceae bacterium]|nr:phospholipase D family protein [Gaiellaceae bacterium]
MEQARLDRIDDVVGDAIERILVGHHRRRLTRLGRRAQFDPPPDGLWCAGDPPPRDGNAVEVLVDGAEALPRLERDLGEATTQVLLAGWTFTPSFRLSRDGPTLRELLAELAERVDVRVLVWAGAPLPLFHPSRGEVDAMRRALVEGTRTRIALDAHERPMHCHHEKLAVVDGRIAYVGGIDLTTLGGDRHDTSVHPARGALGWHDVAARIEGPLVGDVARHLALRWSAVTGEQVELPQPPDDNSYQKTTFTSEHAVRAQLVRTVPERIYDPLPHGDFRILEAYVRALRSAERFVYLESQFLWAPELVSILADKLRHPPHDDFRLVVMLPARAKNGDDDTRGQLGVLVDADRGRRMLACSLFQPGRVEQVYVHAKVGIVDDRWLCIGSANLNDHSLFNDTEVCLITCDEELARSTRLRLWREHLGREDVDGPPHRVVDELWRPIAEAGRDRVTLLPGVSRRSRALLGPLNGLLVDG